MHCVFHAAEGWRINTDNTPDIKEKDDTLKNVFAMGAAEPYLGTKDLASSLTGDEVSFFSK